MSSSDSTGADASDIHNHQQVDETASRMASLQAQMQTLMAENARLQALASGKIARMKYSSISHFIGIFHKCSIDINIIYFFSRSYSSNSCLRCLPPRFGLWRP